MNNSTTTNLNTNRELSDCGNWYLEDGKLYSKYFLAVDKDISREAMDSIHPCAEAIVGWYKETLDVVHNSVHAALEEMDRKPDSYFKPLEEIATELNIIEIIG